MIQVDDKYVHLLESKWHITEEGYARRTIFKERRTILLHRYVWELEHGSCPPLIDHKDGNKLNCRLDNLRPATQGQNQMNMGKQSNNKSGYKGVHKHSQYNVWVCKLQAKGVVYKSTHSTAIAAAKEYNRLALIHHGEFAKLNEI